jgi:hypothetical protein
MKTLTETIMNVVYQSEILPRIRTSNFSFARIIAWADEHPVVWRIVTGRKSKAFGIDSCEYIGWAQRSMERDAIIERARHLYEIVFRKIPCYTPDSIFVWRANFTIEHYQDKGFTGGFFQQHDARYPRSCLTLDYTLATLEEVLGRFCAWMDPSNETDRVSINGLTVRTFPRKES